MDKRILGRTGMQVSPLGFGGAEIGFEQASPDTVAKLLSSALDAGLNVIDTAECYPNSEEMIGQAVAKRRKDFFLFTKCGHPNDPGTGDWRSESLLYSIERSLQRLQTDHLDLIQLHSCSEAELHQGEVIGALQEAKRRGHSRFIGYSGDGAAARYAVDCGQFDTLQISINIADQEPLDDILLQARQRQMGIIAKRPIANVAWKYTQKPENDYHRPYWERLQKLAYPFLRGDPAQAVATALRFTLSIPGVHTAIVGTKNPTRWRENAQILKQGLLTNKDMDAIRERWRDMAESTWVGQI